MRNRNYILSAITVLALLAGCTKEQQRALPVASSEPIVFSTVTPQTKGMPELFTLERLAAQDFSVSAWYTPEGATFGAGSTSTSYLFNRRFGTLDTGPWTHWQGITRTGGKAADPAYYPLDGTLSFFCYAPYQEDVTSASDVYLISDPPQAVKELPNFIPGSPVIRFQPEASSEYQIDFIAAPALLDVNRTSSAIPLDFTKHLTTQLRFYINYIGTVSEGEGIKVSQILIQNVISSEYLYFTESGGTRGIEWCTTISPEDGSSL